MSKLHLGELVNSLYLLLEPHDEETRQKAVHAVQVLFGDSHESNPSRNGNGDSPTAGHSSDKGSNLDLTSNAAEYFDRKQPFSKIEELATAVRFIEVRTKNDSATKSDIEDVFVAARRNFDAKNFRRDIDNAKTKGLFTKSRDKGVFTLSHFGQKYVDALHNREALAQLTRPKTAGRRKPSSRQERPAQEKKKVLKRTRDVTPTQETAQK
jgi:hypothetical protein